MSRQALRKNIAGRTFGKLVPLVWFPARKDKDGYWLCVCKCGRYSKVISANLTCGRSTSCGYHNGIFHGKCDTREYQAWAHAIARCYDTNCDMYPHYGGRGIIMCPEWRNNFPAFLEFMGQCPAGMQIDRINNDGDYEQNNCRWATPKQQQRNKTNTRWVTYQGETLSVAEWVERFDANYEMFRRRLNRGLDIGIALAESRLQKIAYG